MAGPWDNMTKRMIKANPEHFVNWLAAGTTFVTSLDNELKSQHIYADALLRIMKEEMPGLLHLELQTYYDPKMEMRLLEYSVLASRQYDHLPVYSYVICLREEADVTNPPFIRKFLNGEEIHRFYYQVIRLWLIPAEALLQADGIGLLPLVTLTQGGKEPEAVKMMIDQLAEAKEWDLLAISRVIGGLVYKKEPEREWFKRRFNMFQDILRESWVYQEIGQEFLEQGFEKGLEKGLEQGLAKGLEQGIEMGREEERRRRIQDYRQLIINIIQLRFPAITEQATQQTRGIDDPELLQSLNLKLLAVQDLDEAKKILFEAGKQ
jgi:predicted transposase YdaD